MYGLGRSSHRSWGLGFRVWGSVRVPPELWITQDVVHQQANFRICCHDKVDNIGVIGLAGTALTQSLRSFFLAVGTTTLNPTSCTLYGIQFGVR